MKQHSCGQNAGDFLSFEFVGSSHGLGLQKLNHLLQLGYLLVLQLALAGVIDWGIWPPGSRYALANTAIGESDSALISP